jgi:HEAT repeat protein
MTLKSSLRFAAVVVAILAVASDAPAPDAGDLNATPYCPAVTNPRNLVKIDGVEVRAPASAEEMKEAMTMLTWLDRDERLRSAISLGLAGNVEAFSRILESRDLANLSSYGSFYFNPDRIECVAREIEAAMLEAMVDPELRPALTAFFGKNFYQSRELFELLVSVNFEDGKPQDFNRVVMATLATRLEGIEDEVLAQARRYLVHDTPAQKYVLPGVHRRWVEFFGERGHVESIDYMEKLLLAEGYHETADSVVAEYSQTRSRVYRTLDGFDSPEVAEIFIRQLSRVVEDCPPRFVLYELGAFGPFAVSHATTAGQRTQVGELLSALLGLPSSSHSEPHPAATDYRTHQKIVELLSELGTSEAAAVLIEDLRRLTELEDASLADPLIVTTLEGLRSIPESTGLSVPVLLEVAAALPEKYRLHSLPDILDAHPDPAAHAFYLDQLRWIGDNWDGFKNRFQIEPERALTFVIDRLLAYEEPEELLMTRTVLDELYQEDTLDEDQYIATSATLNASLGNESTVYRELQERRQAARDAEVEERRVHAEAEWDEMVAEKTSAEGIQAGLEALGQRGDQSRLATSWLVIAGADAVGPAHEVLADPATPDEARIALLQILGEIGDPRSVKPVIEFTRRNAGNRTYLGAGLRALALMSPSAETFEFARELLGEERTPLMKQQALVYLASVRERRGLEIARGFSKPSNEPDVRVAALLLAARLGDAEVRPAIIEMLESSDDRSYRDVLLRALAELSTPDVFEAFGEATPSLGQTASFRDMRPLVVFRHAEGEPKVEAARHLVRSGHPWDRRDAVRFLVEGGHAEVLSGYLRLGYFTGQPLLKNILHSPRGVQIFAQIRRLGYRVEETGDGLALVRDE